MLILALYALMHFSTSCRKEPLKNTFGIQDASYAYSQFKNEVQAALESYFGKDFVHRGHRAFDIHENSYRVDADVAPFFEHRRYNTNGNYISGVELAPDNGGRVINWPQQHYNNGVQKNSDTNRRFKGLVRILKALCVEMEESGLAKAKNISGFLLECLIWNVPSTYFGLTQYIDDVRACLAYLFNNTRNDEECQEWGEVSELNYLFHPSQKWTRNQAHGFISAAWDYIGFE